LRRGDLSGDLSDISVEAMDDVSLSDPLWVLSAAVYRAFGGAASIVPNPAAIDPIDAIRLPATPKSGS